MPARITAGTPASAKTSRRRGPLNPGRRFDNRWQRRITIRPSQAEAANPVTPGFDSARPPGPISPDHAPSSSISSSGRVAVDPDRQRRDHGHQPQPARPSGPEHHPERPQRQHRQHRGPGGDITACKAPGQRATCAATARIKPQPCPITQSAGPASPKGASSAAITAIGITTSPIAGTDRRFATSPYSASRLKVAAPIGAVARPATAEENTSEATGSSQRGSLRP